jgi:uncharacterized membrane protein
MNVNDWERMLSVTLGAALVTIAFRRERGRASLALTGAGLVVRGVTGRCPVNKALGRTRRRDDTRAALGGSRGIHLDGSIVIRSTADELFRFWRDLRNLPKFMPHLQTVDVMDDTHSHWRVHGPSGAELEWDAEIINAVPPQLIGWRSLPGADVASAGSVSFRQLSPAETEVRVKMLYDPPAGRAGAALAWMMGDSPSYFLQRDLGTLKELFELRPTLGGRWAEE